MVKNILLMLLILSSLSIGNVTAQAAQNDAGSGADAPDNSDTLLPIQLNKTYSGIVGSTLSNAEGNGDYDDYFAFNITEGYLFVTINVTDASEYFWLNFAIEQNGHSVGADSLNEQMLSNNFTIPIISNGTAFFHIDTFSEFVSYNFSVSWFFGEYSQNDAESGEDAGFYNPVTVQLNSTYYGTIGLGHVDVFGEEDINDVFQVSLPSEGYLHVSIVFNGTTPSSLVYIESIDYSLIYSKNGKEGENNFNAPIGDAGTYLLDIFELVGKNVSYQFTLTFTEQSLPKQNDAGSGDDANNDGDVSIQPNGIYQGTIGLGWINEMNLVDFTDTYSFSVSEPGILNLNLTIISTEDLTPFVTIDVFQGSVAISSNILEFGGFGNSFKDNVNIDAGNYYVQINTNSENTTYELGVQFIPDNPTTNITTSENSISSNISNNTFSTTTANQSTANDTSVQSSSSSVSESPFPPLMLVVLILIFILPKLSQYKFNQK